MLLFAQFIALSGGACGVGTSSLKGNLTHYSEYTHPGWKRCHLSELALVHEAGPAKPAPIAHVPAVIQPLTVRSVIAGFLLAMLMASINSYLTLKVGIIEEGTIIVAMLFVLALKIVGKTPTSHEAATVATVGSAGGGFGFIANYFAANTMVGNHLTTTQMVMLPILTSFLGLLMAIPLRRLYVVQEPLPWPTSKATITAITAVTTTEGIRQAKIMFVTATIGGLYVFLSGGLHLSFTPEMLVLPVVGGIALSPFLLAAGYLVGFRVGLGFLLGAVILLLFAPYVPGGGAPQKYFWPGVGFIITSQLTLLIMKGKSVIGALKSLFSNQKQGDDENEFDTVMSGRMFKILTVIGAIATIGLLYTLFDVSVILGLTMFIVGGVVLSFIATRAAGETAFNPIRVMGIMLQGVAAMFGGATPPVLLAGAGVAAGSIDQAVMLTTDNVFGRHFRLTARQQWLLQLAVLPSIACISALVYYRISLVFPVALDSEVLAAPVAKTWASMALVFSGSKALPPYAIEALLIGAGIGICYALIDSIAARHVKTAQENSTSTRWRFFPHNMGLGMGLIIGTFMSLAFFIGSIVFCVLLPKLRVQNDTLNSIAAGGILGEGLIGLIVAILVSFGILAAG